MFTNEHIIERDFSFRKDRLLHNIKRGMYLSQIFMVIILLSLIMVAGTTLFPRLIVEKLLQCLVIYGVYFFFNIGYYFAFKQALKVSSFSKEQLIKWERAISVYILVTMLWGTVMTLMNQTIFYHLIIFTFCCLFCAFLFFTDKKQIIFPTLLTTTILIIGLPFVQQDEKVLYIQLFHIGMIISTTFILSHIINKMYYKSYMTTLHLMQENEQNAKLRDHLLILNEQLDKEVYYDELTQLYNRRGYKKDLAQLFDQANGQPLQLTLMMIDVDFFKQYNDCYGHKIGDKALQTIAQTLATNAHKSGCIVARWGGEEFIAVCETENATSVQDLCRYIQTEIEKLAIPHKNSTISNFLTISIGTSTKTCTSTDDIDSMILNADAALYQVKNSNRNNFVNAYS
ncbi:diguanylate cyclase [Psychrobacillus sp.]|uniref:diguanylate cyclase n=1 Tax=Psychrobacillus sp. TaxID=1871623 RepID=UPI0028BF3BD4|nr:diguanylate cyclase [Psychrobacillus sp.]